MADTVRTRAAILATGGTILNDNTSGDISPQDVRDVVVTMFSDLAQIWKTPLTSSPTAQAIGAATWTKLTGFNNEQNPGDLLSGAPTSPMVASHANDKITPAVSGVFEVTYHISAEVTADTVVWAAAVHVDGTKVDASQSAIILAPSNPRILTGKCFVAASATEDIELWIYQASGTESIEIYDMCLSVRRVG